MARTGTCVLPDGRRMKYGLQRRDRDPFWIARFVSLDGRRMERSTAETSLKRATDAACVIIREEYLSIPSPRNVTWADTIDILTIQWRANNLRPDSIKRYKSALNVVREMYPQTRGPLDITPALAVGYKHRRAEAGIEAITIAEGINCLRFIWRKWLIGELKVLTANPWLEVAKPKLDKKKPAVVSDAQKSSFDQWLAEQYPGWRMPMLFLETKAYLGCRIGELAALRPGQLVDGRVEFKATVSKGRKDRTCKLPVVLYHELQQISGSESVFEAFPAELRQQYLKRGLKHNAARVRQEFRPHYLAKWLEERLIAFRGSHPDVPYFKLHSLRATAISRVRGNDVPAEKASIFFGVTPRVMQAHYEALDETAIADQVAEALEEMWRKCGDGSAPVSTDSPKDQQQ